jgi:hypothetical protein
MQGREGWSRRVILWYGNLPVWSKGEHQVGGTFGLDGFKSVLVVYWCRWTFDGESKGSCDAQFGDQRPATNLRLVPIQIAGPPD